MASSVIGVPLLLGLLYLGGPYWKGLFVLLGLVAVHEYFSMMKRNGLAPAVLPGYLLYLALLFLPLFSAVLVPVIYLLVIWNLALMLVKHPRARFDSLALGMFGPAYIGFLLSYTMRMQALSHPFLVILLALLLTWTSDMGGYFAGRLWGRHKMAPLLSPNKTWEGAAGALAFPLITAWFFFYLPHIDRVYPAYILLLGVGAGLLAQCGDLIESAIKRFFGVKDSGRIIPGHGGVLDRFDGFLTVVPLVYYFFHYLG